MSNISFRILTPDDNEFFNLIANWYFDQWTIPPQKTISRLNEITRSASQFQVMMALNDEPIGTGGLYHHVSLLDKEPRFNLFKHWLALVYTVPEMRGKGYGAKLCDHIESVALQKGIERMHLFTDSAESLYQRLGWAVLERCKVGERTVAVMEKLLAT